MDEVHVLVHADKVKDGSGVGATIFLVADVMDCFKESNAVLGGTCAGPRVHREQLHLHLRRGVLHHQVADLLGVLVPPFLFTVGVIVFPLPFSCFDKVGRVGQIGVEINVRCFELAKGEHCKRAIKLQAVCNMLRDGLDVEVEYGHRLGSHRVVKNDMFKALHGRCKCRLLGLEGAARESLLPCFDVVFLLGLGCCWRLRGSHPIAVGCQSNGIRLMAQTYY